MWKYYDAAKNATSQAASSASGYVASAKEKATDLALAMHQEVQEAYETMANPKLTPLDEV